MMVERGGSVKFDFDPQRVHLFDQDSGDNLTTGWPRMTIRRGEIVYENGEVTGKPGSGKLIRRKRWSRPTLP